LQKLDHYFTHVFVHACLPQIARLTFLAHPVGVSSAYVNFVWSCALAWRLEKRLF